MNMTDQEKVDETMQLFQKAFDNLSEVRDEDCREYAVHRITTSFDDHPDTRPFSVAKDVAMMFNIVSTEMIGNCACEHLDGIQLEPEVLAKLLMIAINSAEVERITDLDLNYWKKVAEFMGPEYAQGLYHAAVFCTKVA